MTGDIRSGRGGQKLWADCTIVTHCTIAGLQAPRLVIPSLAMSATDSLPGDVETLQRLLRIRDAELGRARAQTLSAEALIAHLRLAIEKMRRELYGQRAERKARLLDQMELELEELEAAAAEDEFAAGKAAATSDNTTAVRGFTRRKPLRKPFPAHLPRERVIVPGPTACACCGSTRLAKLGEDVTETLEVVPRQWKVVQYVREKFTCRACERISQAPAPFHVLPRGFAGPSLLAMILFEKYGQHQPLNRQAERYAREGVDLSLSTLADQVGGCAMVLRPLYDLIRAHVFAGDRVHGDDRPVPVLAKGKTVTGRLWTYVRDDRPFGGRDPPAAVFFYSRDRAGDHPERHLTGYAGILQADAYAGFNSFNEIATLRIELQDTDPVIWRQVEVPTSVTLKVLHDIIQAVMGWLNYHLWEFTIGKQRYGLPTNEDWGTESRIEASKVRLRDVLKSRKNVIDYLYDFGDSWEHRITVTNIRPKIRPQPDREPA